MKFFQRLNFFTGLFTTAEDWRREQTYHVEKRKLHARTVLIPGVVAGEGDNLSVTATDEGQVMVLPGYAVDARGRDLYLAAPLTLEVPQNIDTSESREEVVRYVFITFDEKQRDSRPDHQNPQYSGDAFVEEHPVVGWMDEPPDNRERIELARIRWKAGRRITREQIDTNHVRHAGTKRPATLVKSDEIDLNPESSEKGMQFAANDTRIIIKSFDNPQLAAGVVYLTNVYPLEVLGQRDGEHRILWRVESTLNKKGEVVYYLILKNFGSSKVKVRFEIFRLNTALAW